MLCRPLTAFMTMTICCCTSSPSRSPVPLRTDTVPPVSSRPLRRTYLGRGLTGRVQCPAQNDPPHRLVIWSRGEHVIQSSDNSASSRFSVDFSGILVIEEVQPSDAGDYHCALYSLEDDAGQLSFDIRVVVRGE